MENRARTLIQAYIGGWKENNIEKIVAPLMTDCTIVESHGPTYHGIQQIRQWVKMWKKENGKVVRWNITSFRFIEKEHVAVVEWDFACTVSGKDHALLGISLVKFTGEKISVIHEYRMTKSPYNWNENRLRPE